MEFAGLEGLAARPVLALSDGEVVAGLDAVAAGCAVLEALRLRLVREADGRGLGVAAGASGTAAWLRERHRVSARTASGWVRLASVIGDTATGDALAAGAVNVEQAQVIARAVERVPVEHRTAGELSLLEQAAVFGPRELSRLGERLVEVVDPEGAEATQARRLVRQEQRAYAGREVFLTDVGDGRTRLTGWLDAEGAAVVRAGLDALCSPRVGAAVDPADPRTMPQRRADALVDVFRLAMAAGDLPDHGGDRPQLALTIGWERLRDQVGAAHLDDGTALSPAAARRIACDAAILPAVLGGAGQPLDVGRERRLFTGPLRRAVLLRDGGCAFPGCDRPGRWCDVHHVTSWLDGGATCLANAVAVCGHHHRLIHSGQWRVTINPRDGLPDFWPPGYHNAPGPRRNRYHQRQ